MIYGNISYATLTGGGTGGNAYEVRLGYQVLSEDIPNNSRQVRLQLEVRSVKSSYGTYGFAQTSTIDGTTLSSATFDMRSTNTWQIFGNRTITISGAYNGTKTGSFTTNATTSSGNYTLKSGSASVYISLATLHQPPVINSISVSERNSNLSGVSGTTFVANLSNKRFTISASTYDNATITSYKVYQNNSLIGSSSSNTVDINYASVNMYYTQSGASYITPITIKITDSLGGNTTSSITNYTVIPYIVPNIVTTSSSVKRNGQTTGKAKLNLTANSYRGTIGSITNGLTLSFAYWVKEGTESTTYYTIPSNVYSISGNNITINSWNIAINGTEITNLLKENTYYFKIKIQDSFNTNYGLLTCSKGEWLMAKFKDRVDFIGITIGNNNIVESGSNSDGNYVKYYDGTMICYKKMVIGDLAFSSAWGSLYETSKQSLGSFPIAFVNNPPSIYIMPHGAYFVEKEDNPSTTSWGNCWFVRPDNTTRNVTISCFAIGKWK